MENLLKLYVFADMARIPRLMNQAVDAIRSISDKTSLLPATSTFGYVWENTNAESPIRRLLIHWMVWYLTRSLMMAISPIILSIRMNF